MSTATPEVPTIWTTGWTDIFNTGTWRAALPVHAWRPSPCHVDCPVNGDIPTWIKLLAEGDPQAAWLTIAERNPFPAVTGRVCHHPCEGQCNRTGLDGAVGVNSLEHFLGDEALEQGWALPVPESGNGRKVAVVGGGPAGLSCAYQLRRQGCEVTVFEARAELGGLLAWGIPEYRLPKAVVRKEIERLLATGIEARIDSPVAGPDALAALEEEYDAVFVAVGAQRAKGLAHLAGQRVLDGLALLREVNEGRAPELGGRVAVIGGGSAAMDVARTVRRLGAEVSVVCLEDREGMPAQEEEVLEALEEGVVLYPSAMVQSAQDLGGRLLLDCVRVALDPAALPAVRPIVQEGGELSLQVENLVVSIGQDADLEYLGTVLATEQNLLAVDETFATNRAGVFAAGDVASTERFVSVAIGQGRDAAAGILAYLGDTEAAARAAAAKPTAAEMVSPEQVNFYYVSPAERQERGRKAALERLAGFREVAQGLTAQTAAQEAARCISCGTCLECDNCVVFCPDMAIRKDESQPKTYFVLDQYCKGCGLCTVECPRGVVQPEQEVR